MIPVLYGSTETNFNNNGLGLLTDAISCIVTEERNGIFEMVLVYPKEGIHADEITEESLIKAKPNDKDEDQIFRVYKSGKPIAGNDMWYCEHVSYELSQNVICKPQITAATAQEAIEQLIAAAEIQTDYNAYSDIETRNNTKIDEVLSIRKALGGVSGSILDVWGGEFQFDNKTVKLFRNRGADNGVEIRYGKNMLDAQTEKSLAEVVTAIFPYAVYTQDDEEEPEEVFVSLPERIIYTPKMAQYARIRCVPVDFSQSFEQGTEITVAALRQKATAYAESGIDDPKIHITASFVNLWKTRDYENVAALEKVGLCDTVTVIIERYGIREKAKVIKYSYNVLKERFESVEIGDAQTNLTKEISKNEKETKEELKKASTRSEEIRADIEQAIKDATDAITGNSGGYVVLHPANHPQEIMIMDTASMATAQNVWRWNLAGLGHSKTGVNGPFTTAITADGKIVADFIKAGEFDGILIKAGTVKAEALDVEYKNSVKQYSDDGDAAIVADYTAKFQVTNGNITAEVTRATTAESDLADDIDAEETRATGAESALSSRITQTADAITAEVTRATGAESSLSGRITVNADAITSEVTRAQGAESDLADDIDAEETRATGAESALSSRITQTADAITAEVTRATGAESDLSDDIDAEETRATAAETALSGRITVNADAITAEVTRATGAESDLSDDIDAEETRATTAETALSGRITVNADAITAEVTRATGAESSLSGRITVNADAITSEVTRAQGAESDLADDIDAEETRATGAESALSSRITQTADAITAEVTRAQGAESNLSDDIDAEETRATAAETALSGRITVNADAITAEVTRATGAESDLSDDIDAEETRATTAETALSGRITVNADAITAEVTRATGEESSLSTRITQTADAITAEVTRATGEEGALSTRITANADAISLKVSKGDISSEISQEAGAISISSNRLTISSDYFTLAADGTMTATNGTFSGTITAGNGTIAGIKINSRGLSKGIATSFEDLGIWLGDGGFSIIGATFSRGFSANADGQVKIVNSNDSNLALTVRDSFSSVTYRNHMDIYNNKIFISEQSDKSGYHAELSTRGLYFTYGTSTTNRYLEIDTTVGSGTAVTLGKETSVSIKDEFTITYPTSTSMPAKKKVGTTVIEEVIGTYSHYENDTVLIGKNSKKIGFFAYEGATTAATAATQQTVSKISSPSSATASTIASKVNDLIDALNKYNLIKI